MALELIYTGTGVGFLNTEKIDDTDIWFDASGIGWDVEYVTRFEALRSALSGTLICVWDPEYDEARRTWTGVEDCWPAAMAQCLNEMDRELCVAFAENYGLPIVVREAGQTFPRQPVSNGALMIDTSSM